MDSKIPPTIEQALKLDTQRILPFDGPSLPAIFFFFFCHSLRVIQTSLPDSSASLLFLAIIAGPPARNKIRPTHQEGLWLGEVVIAGQFGGFVFQGDEPGYQTNAAELISDHKLRAELNLKNGDPRIHSSQSRDRAKLPLTAHSSGS